MGEKLTTLVHSFDYFINKANQHWEMAGLARLDGDREEAERHVRLARHYEHKAREV